MTQRIIEFRGKDINTIYDVDKCKKIGNRWDNPELLKEEK